MALTREQRRTLIWKTQIRPVMVMERRFFKKLRRLFEQQEDIVLTNLDRVETILPSKNKEFKADTLDKIVDEILFDFNSEVERFADGARPFIQSTAELSGQNAIEGLVSGLSFDSTNETFLKAVNDKVIKFAKDVNQTTLDELGPKLKDVLKEGGNIEQLREKIQGVFDKTVRGTASRSRKIARTETVGAGSLGNIEGYRQSGVVAGKEWLTSRDAIVRETHSETDGVVVPLDDNFSVGDATLEAPGVLISGDVGEIMNCRCILLPARLPA